MKVILINGSPHKDGCTFTALNEVAKSLEQNEIKTEIIHIGLENIRGCIACRHCYKTNQCVFHDCVNEIAKKFEKCDGTCNRYTSILCFCKWYLIILFR